MDLYPLYVLYLYTLGSEFCMKTCCDVNPAYRAVDLGPLGTAMDLYPLYVLYLYSMYTLSSKFCMKTC